jgi:hypothetical protein
MFRLGHCFLTAFVALCFTVGGTLSITSNPLMTAGIFGFGAALVVFNIMVAIHYSPRR